MRFQQYRIFAYKIQTRLIRKLKRYLGETTYLELGIYLPSIKVNRGEIYSELDTYSYLHPRDNIRESHSFSERYTYEIENGALDTKTGIVYDKEQKIVVESSIWPETYHTLRLVPGVRARPAKKIYSLHPIVSPLLLPSNPFYHWLLEDLPSFLYLLDKDRDSKVYVNRDAPSYVTNFLINENIIFEKVEDFIAVEKYRIVSKREDVGWPSRRDVSILRSYFANQFSLEKPDETIYISRLNSTRSPSFERKLQEELQEFGVKTLYLENMSLREQITEFSKARIAIGVHGAGLSGALWMRPGTELVELGPAGLRFSPVFARLATLLNLKYRRIEYRGETKISARDLLDNNS